MQTREAPDFLGIHKNKKSEFSLIYPLTHASRHCPVQKILLGSEVTLHRSSYKKVF